MVLLQPKIGLPSEQVALRVDEAWIKIACN